MKQILARISKLLLLGLIGTWLVALTPIANAQGDKDILFFYGQGCPHCAKVEDYFNKQDAYDNYPIAKKEIYNSPDNAAEFNQIMDNLDVPLTKRGVPTIVMGTYYMIGEEEIQKNFMTAANVYLGRVDTEKESVESKSDETKKSNDINIFVVIGASLVDAINPCAFAVLIILLTSILMTGKPRRAALAGIAFSASIFISYLLMGLGFYKAIGLVAGAAMLPVILGSLAVLLGLFNLKDYFWYGKGFLMEVPRSWRGKLKAIIKSVTSPGGAFLIGFAVSLFLLPCTSGPYIVILGMLADRAEFWTAFAYLILYNIVFVSPMLLITLLVYRGFDPNKAEEIRQKRLRQLHLIAALILIAMGAYLLFWG